MKLSYPAVAGTLAVILAGAALTTALAVKGSADSQSGTLKAQIAAQQGVITALSDQVAAQAAQEQSDFGKLSTPTDPLSAYDQICSAYLNNGTTGLTQTYYYPCTNSVQTIPQPGN